MRLIDDHHISKLGHALEALRRAEHQPRLAEAPAQGPDQAALENERGGEGSATHGCHRGCVIRCSGTFFDKDGNFVTKQPEYETIWAHGANCGIDDLDVIAQLDRLPNTDDTQFAIASGGKGFTALDFGVLHPGGQLGARLKFVGDLMHHGDHLPLTSADTVMSEAIVVMTEKALGCLGVVDNDGVLKGIITDGDLRRHMGDGLLVARAADIMTPGPKTVTPDLMASAALEVINSSSITALFVVENGRPVGIIHIHDLLRAGVV